MCSYVAFCLAQVRLSLSSHCSPSGMTVLGFFGFGVTGDGVA